MEVNEGSPSDDVADYHVFGSPVQESDNSMLIDQGGMTGNVAGKGKIQESSDAQDVQMHPENAISVTLTDGSIVYAHPDSRIDELGILNMTGWPHVVFDVSSQETSFHIPLHRMLSLLLRKSLKKCFGEDAKPEEGSAVQSNEFFSQVLKRL